MMCAPGEFRLVVGHEVNVLEIISYLEQLILILFIDK